MYVNLRLNESMNRRYFKNLKNYFTGSHKILTGSNFKIPPGHFFHLNFYRIIPKLCIFTGVIDFGFIFTRSRIFEVIFTGAFTGSGLTGSLTHGVKTLCTQAWSIMIYHSYPLRNYSAVYALYYLHIPRVTHLSLQQAERFN